MWGVETPSRGGGPGLRGASEGGGGINATAPERLEAEREGSR